MLTPLIARVDSGVVQAQSSHLGNSLMVRFRGFESWKVGSYYYGKQSLDNYLLDINEELQDHTRLFKRYVEISTSHQQQVLETNRAIVDEVHNLRNELGILSTVLQEGLYCIGVALDTISGQLENIRSLLARPRATEANELLQQAEDLRFAGILTDSLVLYQRASTLAPNSPECLYRLGTMYLLGRNAEESVLNLDLAVSTLGKRAS